MPSPEERSARHKCAADGAARSPWRRCGGLAARHARRLPAFPLRAAPPRSAVRPAPIEHVVFIVQENRTFNNLFASFPAPIGTTTGHEARRTARPSPIQLTETNLLDKTNLRHTYPAYHTAYRGGNMDAFNLINRQATGKQRATRRTST